MANSNTSNTNWQNIRVINRKEEKRLALLNPDFTEAGSVYSAAGRLVKVDLRRREVTTKTGNQTTISSIYLYLVDDESNGVAVEFNADNFISAGGLLAALLTAPALYNQWVDIRCTKSKKDGNTYFNYYINGEWVKDPRNWYEENKPVPVQVGSKVVYDDDKAKAYINDAFEKVKALAETGKKAQLAPAPVPQKAETSTAAPAAAAAPAGAPAVPALPAGVEQQSADPADDLPF